MSAATDHATRSLAVAIACSRRRRTRGVRASASRSRGPTPTAQPPPDAFEIGGYAMFGCINFTATRELRRDPRQPRRDRSSAAARASGCRWGGLFVDVGAWRFRGEGERVFVSDDEVFPLGIPVDDHGHADRAQRRLAVPHPAAAEVRSRTSRGGFTVATATRRPPTSRPPTKNVDDTLQRLSPARRRGIQDHALARRRPAKRRGRTVPDAIGDAGVSEAFNETDLGGTTLPRQDHDRPMTPFERQGPDDRVADSGRAGHDLRRRRAAGRQARRGAGGRQHHAARPIGPGLPYHRVIAAGGALGGYSSLQLKARPCWRAEGLTVDPPRRVVGFRRRIRWQRQINTNHFGRLTRLCWAVVAHASALPHPDSYQPRRTCPRLTLQVT